jgi:hypothetical protein
MRGGNARKAGFVIIYNNFALRPVKAFRHRILDASYLRAKHKLSFKRPLRPVVVPAVNPQFP